MTKKASSGVEAPESTATENKPKAASPKTAKSNSSKKTVKKTASAREKTEAASENTAESKDVAVAATTEKKEKKTPVKRSSSSSRKTKPSADTGEIATQESTPNTVQEQNSSAERVPATKPEAKTSAKAKTGKASRSSAKKATGAAKKTASPSVTATPESAFEPTSVAALPTSEILPTPDNSSIATEVAATSVAPQEKKRTGRRTSSTGKKKPSSVKSVKAEGFALAATHVDSQEERVESTTPDLPTAAISTQQPAPSSPVEQGAAAQTTTVAEKIAPSTPQPAEEKSAEDLPGETGEEASADQAKAKSGNSQKNRRSRSRKNRGRKAEQAEREEVQEEAQAESLDATAEDFVAEQESEADVHASGAESEDLFEEGAADADQEEATEENAAGKKDKNQKQSKAEAKLPRRKMFVGVQPDQQVEVVISEEGQVQEYYVEMLQQAKTKGNIYKAVIHNVDANLQAAFVSYGAVKNGFLQIDEVHPEYYNVPHDSSKQRKYPPIQKVLKPGQELLVQIVKEPTGNKGAFLTTYLSMPGRFLVLTPGREQIGVSRKVSNEEERSRLREMLEGLSPGPGLGVIVRTVSMGTSKSTLQRDLQNLKKTWKEVRHRGTTEQAPCLIYQEMDLVTRAVRDYLTDQVVEVWIDDEATANSLGDVAAALFPKKKNLVRYHKDENTPLFERFNIQRQLDQIYSREVSLPSGGRLVIDPTEALTAIDINSGRSNGKNNFEDMAYRTNMEAARMIPLQLRLRDIGGQIVADFIEMRDKSHWREVEKTLREGMKVDRARYDVGKIGPFGMLEIVRQRLGSSAISVNTEVCPYCKGSGIRRNMEWQSQQALKEIQRLMRTAQSQKKTEVVYEVESCLAFNLLNSKRQRLSEMEQLYGVTLDVQPKA